MIIDEILQAIQTTLQASSGLISVSTYHLIDGFIPGAKTTISIGCGDTKYSFYNRTQDEAETPIRIYVYTTDMNPERGESTIRSLASEIRYTLLENMYLGGLVDSSTVDRITPGTGETDKGMLLHFAIVEYSVKYYESRLRPDTTIYPTVAHVEVDADDDETIIMDY